MILIALMIENAINSVSYHSIACGNLEAGRISDIQLQEITFNVVKFALDSFTRTYMMFRSRIGFKHAPPYSTIFNRPLVRPFRKSGYHWLIQT